MRYPTATPVQEQSTAELIRAGTEQVTRLVQDELALARAEMAVKAKRVGLGAGLLGGGGLLALYGVALLLGAAVLGLAVVVPAWLAALIVGAAVLLIAGVMALVAQDNIDAAKPAAPMEAAQSVRADFEAVKDRVRR